MERKMKIAILVQYFPPKWLAGTEIATFNTAKHLAKIGHEIHVITWLDKGLPKKSKEEGFYIHRISGHKVKFFTLIPFWIKNFFCLKKINPDIVHVQNIGHGIPALLSKKLLGKPYVVFGRGTEVYFKRGYLFVILQQVLKNADEVVALTNRMKQEMKKIYNREISIIPNGIDIESLKEFQKKTIHKTNTKKIIFVGSLYQVKGVSYLIHAMKRITENNKNIELLIVGDGYDREYLKNLVMQLNLEKSVIFIGEIPHDEVAKYLSNADVFVLPSLSEGFPNILLEAMAVGIPIVATKVGGLPEIITDNKNGFLVEPKNSDQLADKILHLLRSPKLQKQISYNNLRKASAYSWEKVIISIENIYRKCIENNMKKIKKKTN